MKNSCAFTLVNRVGQALPDNAPAKGHLAAFTLIELLVVVLIIGILAAVAVPQYKVAAAKARYMQLISLANALRTGQDIYKLANGTFTDDIRKLDIDLPSGTSISSSGNTVYYTWGHCQIGTMGFAYCRSTRDGVLYNDLKGYMGILECKVLPGDKADFGKKICLSMGGKYKGLDGNKYFVYHFE